MLLVSMLVQAGDVPDATANAGSPDLCRGRAELPASRHAPVVVIVSWGIVLILAAVQKCILKHVWRVFLDLCMFQVFMGRKDKVEHPAQMLV